MGVFRMGQALRVLVVRASLSGRAMQVISTRQLAALTPDPQRLFLGFGFEWQPVTAQRLYELAKVNWRDYAVSPWLLRLLGYAVDPQPQGRTRAALHSWGGAQGAAAVPAAAELRGRHADRGHDAVRQGCRCPRRYRHPGDPPRRCRDHHRPEEQQAAQTRGRARLPRLPRARYAAHVPSGVPGDGGAAGLPLQLAKAHGLASRVQSIMPPDTAGAFQGFELGCGERGGSGPGRGRGASQPGQGHPLHRRRDRTGTRSLAAALLRRHTRSRLAREARDEEASRMPSAAPSSVHRRQPASSLVALVAYYQHHVTENQRTKIIDSQVRVFRHPREHYQKITANLLPILSMLTSGDLGRSLSPDPFDDDPRPIMNFSQDRARRPRALHVPGLAARSFGRLEHRRARARGPRRVRRNGLQPGRAPAHRAVRERDLQRHQPAADRDPQQRGGGRHLQHGGHAGTCPTSPGGSAVRMLRAWRWAT